MKAKDLHNRLFSFMIVPDNSSEVSFFSFNAQFILNLLIILIVIFSLCLFFIIGYHIKIFQEKNFNTALSNHKQLIKKIREVKKSLNSHTEKLKHIKENDKAFRLIGSMDYIDDSMYEAGIGGHKLIDDTDYLLFDKNLQDELIQISVDIVSKERQIYVLNNSLQDIQAQHRLSKEIINNTPTIYPTLYIYITSGFGWRIHPITKKRDFHQGIDLRATKGQPTFATADGKIISTQQDGKLGKCVVIQHKYGYRTLYGHLDSINVEVGQEVEKGENIGTVGRTGRSTGVHLHYGIYLNGNPQNPMNYFML